MPSTSFYQRKLSTEAPKVHVFEEIPSIAKNPNNYKVIVERVGGNANQVIIKIEDRRTHHSLYQTITEIPPLKNPSTESESTVTRDDDQNVVHIRIPYSFVQNKVKPKEVSNDETQPRDLELNIPQENFRKLPFKYVENQSGYLYHILISDIEDKGANNDNKISRDEASRKTSQIPLIHGQASSTSGEYYNFVNYLSYHAIVSYHSLDSFSNAKQRKKNCQNQLVFFYIKKKLFRYTAKRDKNMFWYCSTSAIT